MQEGRGVRPTLTSSQGDDDGKTWMENTSSASIRSEEEAAFGVWLTSRKKNSKTTIKTCASNPPVSFLIVCSLHCWTQLCMSSLFNV